MGNVEVAEEAVEVNDLYNVINYILAGMGDWLLNIDLCEYMRAIHVVHRKRPRVNA